LKNGFHKWVQSIGNCLICLDPSFLKNFENFCVARQGLENKITKYFFEQGQHL